MHHALDPIVVLGVIAIAGATMLVGWWLSPRQRLLRAMRSVPEVRVADAVDGSVVRIVGVLRSHPAARLVRAPLSGRECACYSVEIDEWVRSRRSGRWRQIVHETEARDFVVEDESGRAIVDARHLEMAVVLDHHQRSGTLNDATPELEAFLARRGRSTTGFFGLNKTLRYREGVLEPGETVAVVGRARWEDDPEPGAIDRARERGGYRESGRARRLVIEPSELGPVRASDEPSARS